MLIIGNSQARDFANILFEMNVLEGRQLLYRAGLPLCAPERRSVEEARLVAGAEIIFLPVVALPKECADYIAAGGAEQDNVIFVGPKHFGYNLNAFVSLPEEGRAGYINRMFDDVIRANTRNTEIIPAERYLNPIEYASPDGSRIHIFGPNGDIISADRVHITRAGAQFFASRIGDHPALASLKD